MPWATMRAVTTRAAMRKSRMDISCSEMGERRGDNVSCESGFGSDSERVSRHSALRSHDHGLRQQLTQIIALLCLRRHTELQPALLYMSVSPLLALPSHVGHTLSPSHFRMPFVDPTTSRTCAHSFCRDCIGPALQASPHCPIDRSPLSPQDMAPSNPIVRHVCSPSF